MFYTVSFITFCSTSSIEQMRLSGILLASIGSRMHAFTRKQNVMLATDEFAQELRDSKNIVMVDMCDAQQEPGQA